jgi:hypothetical protein
LKEYSHTQKSAWSSPVRTSSPVGLECHSIPSLQQVGPDG